MAATAASLYNDFAGLAELKYQARQDQAGSADKVARQFESLFVQMMVKQMRQAGFGGGILDSDRTRFYQEMYDQQLSLQLAEQGGLGLRRVLRRQLGGDDSQEQTALVPLEDYWRHPVARGYGGYGTPNNTNKSEANSGTAIASPNASGEDSGTPNVVTGNVVTGHPKPNSGTPTVSPNASAVSAADTAVQACSPALDSPQAFVRHLWSCARQAADELGLPPEALLAQAALETGWGRAVMSAGKGGSSHNLFGIKADPRWQGEAVHRQTLEYVGGLAVRRREAFRAYDSFNESFQDYVALLKGSPRYTRALQKSGDPAAYFKALQDAGYATDPAYADKILRVMKGPEMRAALARISDPANRPVEEDHES